MPGQMYPRKHARAEFWCEPAEDSTKKAQEVWMSNFDAPKPQHSVLSLWSTAESFVLQLCSPPVIVTAGQLPERQLFVQYPSTLVIVQVVICGTWEQMCFLVLFCIPVPYV